MTRLETSGTLCSPSLELFLLTPKQSSIERYVLKSELCVKIMIECNAYIIPYIVYIPVYILYILHNYLYIYILYVITLLHYNVINS